MRAASAELKVATDSSSPRPEDDNAKRRQILNGARAVFLDRGFDGASMGEIARAAGVSKGTLYVYFTDKHALFAAIVEQESTQQRSVTYPFDPGRPASETLNEFGCILIGAMCAPDGGSSVRTVMAIAERMPELGRAFYERVIAQVNKRLTDYLAARVEAGELAIPDCPLAAAQFIEACKATLFLPYVFQMMPTPSAEHIRPVVESATRMFLAAYRAAP